MIDLRRRIRCPGCRRRVIDGVGITLCERCYAGSGADWRLPAVAANMTFNQRVYRAMLIRRYVRVLSNQLDIELTGPSYMAASDYVRRELERARLDFQTDSFQVTRTRQPVYLTQQAALLNSFYQ